MERVSKACGEFLVASLTPDNCLSIRNIPGITSNPDLVEQIDKFIFEQASFSEEKLALLFGGTKIQTKK